ncbi:DNA-directed RNA polymerase subunit omega [Nanchangia anserum]|uniref:DNA-directed RNA polymerase subunit omega n=1 Tax=Nanchangia anserum TaxID=2692125 RepID=A0A8I0GEW6_9ACTO|nr:DNA-directed RNA polymerase subunit omega [Nanchangia anserum]MBD3688789.1 DNA-directed RNA polymerase subunit omega [Nanchangia anserum]QOX82523.1 DNA-directed RNA polymerase subunit omega [Nanchangia anserum]
MSGITAQPVGITNPPIDDLLTHVESKYALVVFAARRARQINTYNQQISDGMFTTPGPLVESSPDEKPISIALREVNEGLLTMDMTPKTAETD